MKFLAALTLTLSIASSTHAWGTLDKWIRAGANGQPAELKADLFNRRGVQQQRDLLSPQVRAEFEKALANLASRDDDSIVDPNGMPYDAEVQYVSVDGEHEWRAPGPDDTRGPCPGLNVLANHGYFNRDGTVSLTQAIQVVNDVFGLGPDLGAFLSAYAVVFTGNILDGEWSVGGPFYSDGLGVVTNRLAGRPEGLNSHNVYEGDASLSRWDYYANKGDDYTSNPTFFKQLVDLAGNDQTKGKDVYNADVLTQHKIVRFNHSISTNPYFFSSPIGGLIVTTAAHDFVVNFMSNNTDDGTGRNRQYLDEANLFPFFSYERLANGPLKYTPGHERFPPNWRRRPLAATYGLADVIANFLRVGLVDTRLIAIGGNVGKVNTFAGIQVGNLTGGLLNVGTLLSNPDAFACFLYQASVESLVPSQLKFIYKDITDALNLVNDLIGRPLGAMAFKYNPCPDVSVNAPDAYSKYPGSVVGKKKTNGLLGVVGSLLKGLGGVLSGSSRRGWAERVYA
ncbi:hypothetical protein V8E36_009727 [Tilletia maclaganii]